MLLSRSIRSVVAMLVFSSYFLSVSAQDAAMNESIHLLLMRDEMNQSSTSDSNYTLPPSSGRPNSLVTGLVILTYCFIFVLAVVGNSLVIVTLIHSRRMRTVTNVLLLNLSISDLVMALICIPPQLTAFLIRGFIFGHIMCPLHRYLQGVCVAVSVYTLLTLSLERFFAIVLPLWSRRWQTLSHAYRMIGLVWVLSLVVMSPLAVVNRLVRLEEIQVYKCDEFWNDETQQLVYTFTQLLVVFLVPLVGMCVSYVFIVWKLRRSGLDRHRHAPDGGSKRHHSHPELPMQGSTQQQGGELILPRSCASVGGRIVSEEANEGSNNLPMRQLPPSYSGTNSTPFPAASTTFLLKTTSAENGRCSVPHPSTSTAPHSGLVNPIPTSANITRNTEKVVKMLVVVVMEFFLTGSPIFIVNTWASIDAVHAREHISPGFRMFISLLFYTSTCCNPITYCFMNSRFRHHFLRLFGCGHCLSNSHTSVRGFHQHQNTHHSADRTLNRGNTTKD